MEALTGNLFAVAVALTAVFLVVGGIVIMNIMLASVTERTREIGIRRSLGARKNHILLQFMTESAVLAAVGGLIGIILGLRRRRARTRRDVDPDADSDERGDFVARGFHRRRTFLRNLSGHARRKARPDRSAAFRLRTSTPMAQSHGENLKQAMDTLRTHKLRSALTVFGVVLGVSVIMLVAALITGFDQQIQENIKQFGADTAFISRWDQGPHNDSAPAGRAPAQAPDARGCRSAQGVLPAVRNVTTYIDWWEKPHIIRTKAGEVTGIDFRGVQPNFGEVYANAATLAGRFISEGDDLHRENVVMLGENVAPVLFPDTPAVGKDVMIDGQNFQVIGVVEKPKGLFGTGDEDRRVLIPYNTFRKVYPASRTRIRSACRRIANQLDQAVDQVTEVLRRRRNVRLQRARIIFRFRPPRCRCRSSTTSWRWSRLPRSCSARSVC